MISCAGFICERKSLNVFCNFVGDENPIIKTPIEIKTGIGSVSTRKNVTIPATEIKRPIIKPNHCQPDGRVKPKLPPSSSLPKFISVMHIGYG